MNSQELHWNQFFSILAFAEKAAADQCELIADEYSKRGDQLHESLYRKYAAEERGHHALVKSICRDETLPSKRAQEVYDGKLLPPDAGLGLRLALVHLAFEPSALAYLGYFSRHAPSLLCDQQWAKATQKAFRKILREEVVHIYRGKNCLELEWERADDQEKQKIRRGLRLHSSFLALGLKTFFPAPESQAFVEKMVRGYRKRVLKLCQTLPV